jgi:hypothetical protein
VGEARSLPLNGAPKIRLGWKGLPGTNALAYYENPKSTIIKCFIGFAPGHWLESFSTLFDLFSTFIFFKNIRKLAKLLHNLLVVRKLFCFYSLL